MKPVILACVGLLAFAPVAAIAQERTPPAGSTSSGAAVPRGGEGGGTSSGSTMSSGGSMSGGGSSSSGGYSGGGSTWGGGRSDGGAYTGGSRGAGNRGGADYNAPASVSRTMRNGESYAAPREIHGTASVGQPVPGALRPRGDGPVYGKAVPRGTVPPKPQPTEPGGGSGGSGYYDWHEYGPYGWWGMYGYGYGYGYGPYGSYYGYGYPYQYYGWGYPFQYYGWSYYNPWSSWGDDSLLGMAARGYYSKADEGGLRLKVKPKDAEVWVDGYFEGPVSGYDGVFKSLKLSSGNHRVEIKAKGYETLSFDVRVMPGRTVTYSGQLTPTAVK